MYTAEICIIEIDHAGSAANRCVFTHGVISNFRDGAGCRGTGRNDGDCSVLHTTKIPISQIVQTQQLNRQFWRGRVAVDVGINVGNVIGYVFDVPNSVGRGSGTTPVQVSGTEQLGEVDLVEFGGGCAWVANGREVSNDIFG